jgi:hypothetical protein
MTMTETVVRSDATMVRSEGTGLTNWPTKGINEWMPIIRAAIQRHPQDYLTDMEWAQACGGHNNGPFTQKIRSALEWTALEQGPATRRRETKLTGFGVQLQNFVDFPDKEAETLLPAFVTAFKRIYQYAIDNNWLTMDAAGVHSEAEYRQRSEKFGELDARVAQFLHARSLADAAQVGDVMGVHRALLTKVPVRREAPTSRPERPAFRTPIAAPPVTTPVSESTVAMRPVALPNAVSTHPQTVREYHVHVTVHLPHDPA